MDPGTNWLAPALVGAVASYLVGHVREWQGNTQRARGLLRGVLVEMDHAHACASAYLAEAVHRLAWTPAYRIELDFLQSGVRTLLELRALRPEEVTAIHGLYVSVSEVNRCLESLTRLYERASPDSLDDAWGGSAATGPSPPILPPQMPLETQRTIIKCQNVLRQLPEARAAAESALGRLTWLEPQD